MKVGTVQSLTNKSIECLNDHAIRFPPGVFEMDYSPLCTVISHGGVTRRMYLNVSQGGCPDWACDQHAHANDSSLRTARLSP